MLSLKEKYQDYFKIGCCVSAKTVETHADLITTHFNSITCENEMKYISVCNERDNYRFKRADRIVSFAREHHIPLRGHTFVWHNQTPDFIFERGDKEEALETLREHIIMMHDRYGKDTYCWDVVNEAIEDKSDEYLRDTPWRRLVGDYYMDDAFRIAKEIMPEQQLFYNDYNEIEPFKMHKIIRAVTDMKERGIPIDGVGLQCHFKYNNPNYDKLKRAIELYAATGLRLQITEMDVSMFANHDESKPIKPDAGRLEQQAKTYDNCFKVFREYKDVIDCVTLWGIADDVNWLDNFPVENRKNWPLLFDEEHKPKEALLRILDF